MLLVARPAAGQAIAAKGRRESQQGGPAALCVRAGGCAVAETAREAGAMSIMRHTPSQASLMAALRPPPLLPSSRLLPCFLF